MDLGASEILAAAAAGLVAAVDSVGWVLVPQILLAIAVLGLALQKLACRAAGFGVQATPAWLDPAVESALLLGLLGTIAGMVSGFLGISPDELEPGPLVYGLGSALRSSFIGFLIALVGVWTKARTGAPARVEAVPR
jgi:hypothetical protein